jgi:CRISPR/Cas system CMR subunit Cmr6 (Cas7 group RAMP superfamily)
MFLFLAQRGAVLDDAETLLQAALQEYGVGDQTSAGYGRFGPSSEESA